MSEPRKKILFCFFQTGDQSNGGVVSLLTMARSLKNYTPVFLTQTRTRRSEELSRHGFTVIHNTKYNWHYPLLKPISVLLWNLMVISIIRKHRISLLHANDNQMVWRTIFSAKLCQIGLVASIRGVFEPGVKYGANRLWVNFCDQVIVLSNEMRKDLCERLPFSSISRAEKCVVTIPSVISDDFYLKANRGIERRENKFAANVLVVAAFNPLKNQLTFLKETARWFMSRNICVHFVGDYDPENDEYSRKCAKVVSELNVSAHTVFHGFNQEVHLSYLNADLTLVVSRREGLARCMIESLACGVPVISFDVCSASEVLVENNCGIVVKQGDYQRLCDEVQSLLADRERMARMRVNGLTVSKRLFNTDDVIAQYEQVYNNRCR